MTTRFQTMRLIWIDAFIEAGEFPLRRKHLCFAFDISDAQAAIDLKRFHGLFPDRLDYDRSDKGYRAAAGSSPVFLEVEHSAIFVACARAAHAHDRIAALESDEAAP
ncbi:hypothetical protein [Martelella soudanensis]|uniref:hypothetical protein n=1 Tax=unclassified Martelella TaxID=2629616 RepID=UPI0015DF7C27|nr:MULTISPECIES: hypothetical protein [unclassified Martelella]